jgi:hypothetical protein
MFLLFLNIMPLLKAKVANGPATARFSRAPKRARYGPQVPVRKRAICAGRDSYAPLAGAPLFAPPASGGIWAAAHQRRLFRYFVFLILFYLKVFLALLFTDSLAFFSLMVFSVLLGDFLTFKI